MIESKSSPRSVCLDALVGELILSTLLHDLRGELGVVQGWVEVAALEGQLSSPRLDQGLVVLGNTLAAASDAGASLLQFPPVSAEDLLKDLPGTRLPVPDILVHVCLSRFREAMTLAAPESVALHCHGATDRVVLEVSGLTEEGVSQACRPSIGRLAELKRSRSDDRTLGATLLRAVVGSAGGHLRSGGRDKMELHFRGGID